MFADDTSLFKIVDDVPRSADELNAALDKIQLWAWKCNSMQLKPMKLSSHIK